jgi:hypothetical protein
MNQSFHLIGGVKTNKKMFYTDDRGLRNFEDGEVFYAKQTKNEKYKHAFIVDSNDVLEKKINLVVIDTGCDAEFV